MSISNKPYIIVSGATATGKTSTSIKIARYLKNKYGKDSEVVNFDSLLFYKELNIGTAKPTTNEMKGVKHHLIDIASISTPLNASDYIREANKTLNTLFDKNIIPILCGGSAFYVRALLKGMIESSPKEIITNKQQELIDSILIQIDKTINYLKSNDPDVFTYIHRNDQYRLGRAVEYHILNNKKYSEKLKKINLNDPYDFSKNNQVGDNFINIYLDIDKSTHLEIIKDRIHTMLKDGLIDEVKDLIKTNSDLSLKPLGSIGYKETIRFIKEGEISSNESLVEDIFISTRQLAKAQKTFFKKITPKIRVSPLSNKDILFSSIDDFINK